MDDLIGDIEVNKPETQSQQTRPKVITLIALYQFLKAAFLLAVAAIILNHPETKWGSDGFREMFFAVTNGVGGGKPSLLTPVLGIYAAIVGWGLWRLKNWARNVLIATTGLTALRWIIGLPMNSVWQRHGMGRPSLRPGYQQQSVAILLVLDLAIFCCLKFSIDTIDAFRKQD